MTLTRAIVADDIRTTQGERLRELVKAAGMTQAEAAALAYPDRAPASALRHLQRLMSGNLDMRPGDVAALSSALSVPWRELYAPEEAQAAE